MPTSFVVTALYVEQDVNFTLQSWLGLKNRKINNVNVRLKSKRNLFWDQEASIVCNWQTKIFQHEKSCLFLSSAIPVVNHQFLMSNSMPQRTLNPYYIPYIYVPYKGMIWWYFLQKFFVFVKKSLWNPLCRATNFFIFIFLQESFSQILHIINTEEC